MTRRTFAISAAASAIPLRASAPPPIPYGVLPSERQLQWHRMETYAFLHFTVNTFTDKEWGNGDEDPRIFNPTSFDADAIVEALKAGGMKGVILTCKHHDGFCLWPTRTTEHSIKGSPWRGGKGDIVREISEAARGHGLPFGVYLSPWDRNHPQYGKPEYVAVYRQQLRELLTDYGPVFEVWHDGANGGDGYYGGAREKRTIDKHSYYGWPETWQLVRSLQPNAVIFSDVGPDIRWVGNENGIAGETCWATHTPVGETGGPAAPGDADPKGLNTGTRNGKQWLPAECDVSIRPGWFWHESENGKVKTPEQLMELYLNSVGRGASFLLNVPPDRRGLLHENDVAALRSFGTNVRNTFSRNLAATAKVTASNVRGRSTQFRPEHLLDDNPDTYWATDDGVRTPQVVIELPRPVRFEFIRVREQIRLGQRVEAISVDAFQNGEWRTVAEATSIGAGRICRISSAVEADRVRLRVTQSPVCPALTEFALFTSA
jgi:alpha-L-fucosidase